MNDSQTCSHLCTVPEEGAGIFYKMLLHFVRFSIALVGNRIEA